MRRAGSGRAVDQFVHRADLRHADHRRDVDGDGDRDRRDGRVRIGHVHLDDSLATSGGGTCQVVYSTQSQWSGGFVAAVTITNTGPSAISGWTLTFTFPGDQKITSNWSGRSASPART